MHNIPKQFLESIPLCGNEEHDREIIQSAIHEHKLKTVILYEGNVVWDANKLVKNMKTIVKHNDMTKMSKYMYNFLSLACGSIAHFNKHGWIDTYPTVDHLRGVFQHNEYGRPVVGYIPLWKSDAKKAAKLLQEILKNP